MHPLIGLIKPQGHCQNANVTLPNVTVLRDDLEDIHATVSPGDARNVLKGQQLDQVARFLFEVKAGDFVVTPSLNTEHIYYGTIQPEPNYYYDNISDACPYVHRKRVIWCASPIPAGMLPAPIQIAMRSSLSVFPINQKQSFLETIENAPVEMMQEAV